MEQRRTTRTVERRLEGRVLTLLAARQTATFLALADAFPAVPWGTLFRVLFRLRAQHLVTLRPSGWDYEVTLCRRAGELRAGVTAVADRGSEVERPTPG